MTAMDKIKQPQVYALTVDDYVMLSDAGAFKDFAKTELIEGVIIPVNALYSAHAVAQRHIFRELDAACLGLKNGLEVLFEISARINPNTMPRPDVLLTRMVPPNGPIERQDVALAVEITDTTHDVDLGPKPRVYAQAGVPEYWVVDLKARLVHVFWSPGAEGYGEHEEVRVGAPVVARSLTGIEVDTSALLS